MQRCHRIRAHLPAHRTTTVPTARASPSGATSGRVAGAAFVCERRRGGANCARSRSMELELVKTFRVDPVNDGEELMGPEDLENDQEENSIPDDIVIT